MQPLFDNGTVTVQASGGDDTPLPTVPAPTALALLVFGLVGLKLRRRQQRD